MPPIDKLLSQYSEPVRSWPGEAWQDEEARANYAAANPRPPQQLRPDERYRGAVLPFRETTDGRHEWAVPGVLQDVFDSARAVRDTSGIGLGPATRPSQMRPEEFDQVLGHGMAGAMTGVTGGLARAAVSPRLAAGEMELGSGGGRQPIRAYHGAKSAYEGDGYNPTKSQYKAFFAAEDPTYASTFAREYGDAPRVYPVDISPDARLFDFANPEHTARLVDAYEKGGLFQNSYLMGKDTIKRMLAEGDAGLLEDPGVQRWLRKNKYDGWRFVDTAGPHHENRVSYGMLKPGRVHSATTGDLLYGAAPLAGGAAALTLEDILSAYGKEQ